MSSELGEHWDGVYDVDPTTRKWHQELPAPSLAMLDRAGVDLGQGVIDIGGGASRLVERLLDLEYRDVTVLDISSRGLAHAQLRLGGRAEAVTWIVADVTRHRFERTFDLWHDRAVFHFLTAEEDRRRYLEAMRAAVIPGGHAIIGTFGPAAPEYCSGLPVVRYAPARLIEVVGEGFAPEHTTEEQHRTPGGELQPFTWGLFRREVASD